MPTLMFRKQFLVASMATAMASTALAQADAPTEGQAEGMEEVVVTGIRASLERAQDIKRESQGVVDSISAEDIGKFPDTNLAESLQRITGVSIDRSNGEGQKITVRGLGPDFNLVTLNGRHMPTSGLQSTAVNAGRSFDFSNIASEGIAGVDVYKTGRADVATGGIGAAVNVKTTKPLDAPGMKFTAGIKGVYDESSVDPELTPEISALYSNTFGDDKFGVAIAVSDQQRQGGFRQVSVPNGWHTQSTIPVDGWFGGMDLTDKALTDEDYFLRPQNLEYNFTEFERDRTNAQLTLQARPVESLTFTLDYTYSEQEIASQTNTLNVWFWEGELADNLAESEWALGSANNAGGDVYYPVVYGHAGGEDLVYGVGDFAQINKNNSIGFNVEWQATENLTLELDYHDSRAESASASPYGNSSVIQVASFVRSGAIVDFSQDFAVMGATDGEGGFVSSSQSPAGSLDPTGSSLRNSRFTNDIEQLQVRGKYEFDEGVVKSVDFGFAQTDNSIHRGLMTAQRDNWGSDQGTPDDLRDDVFVARSVLSDFDSANATGSLPNSENTFNQFDRWYYFDFADHAADIVATQAPANSSNEVDPAVWPCEDRFCVNEEWTTNQRTTEEMMSAYVQANLEFELPVGLLKATVGVRQETTDVVSTAVVPAYTGIRWVADNEFSLIDSGDSSSTFYDSSYENFLPNIDLALEVGEDVVVRASYSETIARANYNDIAGGVSIGTLRNIDGDASRGDPTLLPHESTNLDLSFEWYFGDASYVSLGAFRKDVENFVGFTEVKENLFGLRNPSQGPRFEAAQAALGTDATNSDVRDYIFDMFPESSDDPAIWSLDEDPLYDFKVSIPVNSRDAVIEGFEFAIQHTLPFGLGAQFNYTVVESDAEYDVTEFETQFALTGLSDTMNLVGFYENEDFQVRVAYNWRDAFLANVNRSHGNPEFVEEYSQIDINASYNINDGFSVFVEGINVTDETTRSYSRYEGALQSATELGARYNIGARYTF